MPQVTIGNETEGVTLLNYWYPTFSLTKPVAEFNTDYLVRSLNVFFSLIFDKNNANNVCSFLIETFLSGGMLVLG
jgi:hypothetical protein